MREIEERGEKTKFERIGRYERDKDIRETKKRDQETKPHLKASIKSAKDQKSTIKKPILKLKSIKTANKLNAKW